MAGLVAAAGHVVSLPVRCGAAVHKIEFRLSDSGRAEVAGSPYSHLPDFLRPQQVGPEPACVVFARGWASDVPTLVALADLDLPEPKQLDRPLAQRYATLRRLIHEQPQLIAISGPAPAAARVELIARLLNDSDACTLWANLEKCVCQQLAPLSAGVPETPLIVAMTVRDSMLAKRVIRAIPTDMSFIEGVNTAASKYERRHVDYAVGRLWSELCSEIEVTGQMTLIRIAAELSKHPSPWCLLLALACLMRSEEYGAEGGRALGGHAKEVVDAVAAQLSNRQLVTDIVEFFSTRFLSGPTLPHARHALRSTWLRHALIHLARQVRDHCADENRKVVDFLLRRYGRVLPPESNRSSS